MHVCLGASAGCRDYAPYLATSAAVRMWRTLGPERARAYMHDLLTRAVALLTATWGTQPLVAPDSGLCAPGMALVQLPRGLHAAVDDEQPATSADAKFIQVTYTNINARTPCVPCMHPCMPSGWHLHVRVRVHATACICMCTCTCTD